MQTTILRGLKFKVYFIICIVSKHSIIIKFFNQSALTSGLVFFIVYNILYYKLHQVIYKTHQNIYHSI